MEQNSKILAYRATGRSWRGTSLPICCELQHRTATIARSPRSCRRGPHPVQRAQRASGSERYDEPMLAVLEHTAHEHCADGIEPKRRENVHPAVSRGLQLSPRSMTRPPADPSKGNADQSVARDRLHGDRVQDYEYASCLLKATGGQRACRLITPPPGRGLARCGGGRFCHPRGHVTHASSVAPEAVKACIEH